MKVKTKTINDYSPAEIGWLSRSTLEVFEERAANLMATFDAPKVYTAVASLLRLEGLEEIKDDFDLKSLLKVTQRAFLTLLKRGALDGHVRYPISTEGQHELDSMNLAVYGTPEATRGSTSPTPTPNPINECVKDFRDLGSKAFKQKWMDNRERRAIYNTAISQGAI